MFASDVLRSSEGLLRRRVCSPYLYELRVIKLSQCGLRSSYGVKAIASI